MKRLGTFQSSQYGAAVVTQASYGGAKGPIAIILTGEDGERLTVLSVNMYKPECSHDSKALPPGCFYAKDYGGNETLADEALKSGLFKVRADLPMASSGYVEAPVWQIVGATA